jgi:RHS repeat-associated protein
MTIDYTYDPLNRLIAADYSNGTAFSYTYDAAGNTLEYGRTTGGQTVTTMYTYDAANQLTTAQTNNMPDIWHYAYDGNGSLIQSMPGENPTNGASRYTYNTAGFLVGAESHDGSHWSPQAQMSYDGLGERLDMTAFAPGGSVATQYELDNGQVLSATVGENTTSYLYGLGPISELTDTWTYGLPDGTNTQRQVSNTNGEITFASSYTPWGNILSVSGTANVTQGYFGGILDAATGLIYMGSGQYYDPQTGRFINRNTHPDQPNPYVPGNANPSAAFIAPLALLSLFFNCKRKRSRLDTLIILCVLCIGVSVGLAACGAVPNVIQFKVTEPTEMPNPIYNIDVTVDGGAVWHATVPEAPSDSPTIPCEDLTFSLARIPFSIDSELALYGVTLDDNSDTDSVDSWTESAKLAIRDAIRAVAAKLASTSGNGVFPIEVFRRVYNGVNFTWGHRHAIGTCATIPSGGCTSTPHQINFVSLSIVADSPRNNVVHELGHAFSYGRNYAPQNQLNADRATNVLLQRGTDPSLFYGFASNGHGIWQQHACNQDDHHQDHPWPCEAGDEMFADQFLGWTFGQWDTAGAGPDPDSSDRARERANWMDDHMRGWINQ